MLTEITPDSEHHVTTSAANLSENFVATSSTKTTAMHDVEMLVNDLKRLLVQHELAIDEEGLRENIETLERWAESYRRGLKAAQKLSEVAPAWLGDMRDRLKLASEELQRMEEESPGISTHAHAAKAEELLHATRKIDKVIPAIEQICANCAEEPVEA